MIIGLTGGPGAGKTTVAKMLARRGAKVLSGDDAGREAAEKFPSVRRKLIRSFGMSILNSDGTFNRRELGRIVFRNPADLKKLNVIIHPPLLKILKSQVERYRHSSTYRLVVIDAALVFEWGIANWCDYILVVAAKRDTRIKRLKSTGLTRKEVEDRISSQLPQRVKVALADYVIENNGSTTALQTKVGRFLDLLKRAARDAPKRH